MRRPTFLACAQHPTPPTVTSAALTHHCCCFAPQEDLCVKSEGRQYINLQEEVVGGDSQPQLFCAWDVLFR